MALLWFQLVVKGLMGTWDEPTFGEHVGVLGYFRMRVRWGDHLSVPIVGDRNNGLEQMILPNTGWPLAAQIGMWHCV